MGKFDTIWVDCPQCGDKVAFQSKSGPCDMSEYDLAVCPVNVLHDIIWCHNCICVVSAYYSEWILKSNSPL